MGFTLSATVSAGSLSTGATWLGNAEPPVGFGTDPLVLMVPCRTGGASGRVPLSVRARDFGPRIPRASGTRMRLGASRRETWGPRRS